MKFWCTTLNIPNNILVDTFEFKVGRKSKFQLQFFIVFFNNQPNGNGCQLNLFLLSPNSNWGRKELWNESRNKGEVKNEEINEYVPDVSFGLV